MTMVISFLFFPLKEEDQVLQVLQLQEEVLHVFLVNYQVISPSFN